MPIPPRCSPPYDELPGLITRTFQKALEDGNIDVFRSESRHIHSGTGAFDHLILICPELDEKPGPPQEGTPDLRGQPDEDPFDGPEYKEGQSIAALDDHFLLTNENAMTKNHIMAVSKEFRPQAGSLLEKDLATAYLILKAHKRQGQDVLCFYNGGPLAGASQPHLHVQFAPWIDGVTPGAEKMALAEHQQLIEGVPGLLPTPHVHYVVRLAQHPSSETLFKVYQELLDVFRRGVEALPESSRPNTEDKRDSYNLLLSLDHMHLIPRSDEGGHVPHPRTKARKAAKGEDPEEVTEKMKFNGFTAAGIWFVGSEAERDDLLEFGLERAITEAGYVRTPSWMPRS